MRSSVYPRARPLRHTYHFAPTMFSKPRVPYSITSEGECNCVQEKEPLSYPSARCTTLASSSRENTKNHQRVRRRESVCSECTFADRNWASVCNVCNFPIRPGGVSVYIRKRAIDRRAISDDHRRRTEAPTQEHCPRSQTQEEDAGREMDDVRIHPQEGKQPSRARNKSTRRERRKAQLRTRGVAGIRNRSCKHCPLPVSRPFRIESLGRLISRILRPLCSAKLFWRPW